MLTYKIEGGSYSINSWMLCRMNSGTVSFLALAEHINILCFSKNKTVETEIKIPNN